jgi:hypothetical protein
MNKFIAVIVSTVFAIGTLTATSNTDYTHWSTQALQQKRIELYKQLPVRGNRKNIAIYVKHGEPLPQEDEIRLIERELNTRHTRGDKAAYFEPAAPSIYRHKNPNG